MIKNAPFGNILKNKDLLGFAYMVAVLEKLPQELTETGAEFGAEKPGATLVDAVTRLTDDQLGGMAAIERTTSRNALTEGAGAPQQEGEGAAIGQAAGKISMSGDGRGKVGSDDAEKELDSDLANPEAQMKMLAELMAEMGEVNFTMEMVLESLLDDRDIPGLERPSTRRMQQLIQVLYFYSLQQAGMNPANPQAWVRSEMIQRLYTQLKMASNAPNPDAAFKQIIKSERAAIGELRQQLNVQGLAKVPLSQLTTIVVARQMLPLQQAFQTQLNKLTELQKQAVSGNTTMRNAQVLQMQIAMLRDTLAKFQSPALKPLLDYARAINAQIATQMAAQNNNAQTAPTRLPGQIPAINFAALPRFTMTAATLTALSQTITASREMLRNQQEWSQGRVGSLPIADSRGVQLTTLPPAVANFWQQQAQARTTQSALRPQPPREMQSQVAQIVQDISAVRATAAINAVSARNPFLADGGPARIGDPTMRLQQLRTVTANTDKIPGQGVKQSLFIAPATPVYGTQPALRPTGNGQALPIPLRDGAQALQNRGDRNTGRQAQTPNSNGQWQGSDYFTRLATGQNSRAGAPNNTANPTGNRAAARGDAPAQDVSPRLKSFDPAARAISDPQRPGETQPARQPGEPPANRDAKPESKGGQETRAPETKNIDAKNQDGQKPEPAKEGFQKSNDTRDVEIREKAAAEQARLAEQGVKSEVTGWGVMRTGQEGLDVVRKDWDQQAAKRTDLQQQTCPVGGKKAAVTAPKPGQVSGQYTPSQLYSGGVMAASYKAVEFANNIATKLGITTKVGEPKVVKDNVSKGPCDICNGCGGCGSAGKVLQALTENKDLDAATAIKRQREDDERRRNQPNMPQPGMKLMFGNQATVAAPNAVNPQPNNSMISKITRVFTRGAA